MFFIFSILRNRITYPKYEEMRFIRPVLQLWTVANPSLDWGCVMIIFNPYDEVCTPIKIDNIIHKLVNNRYEYNRQQLKYRKSGNLIR